MVERNVADLDRAKNRLRISLIDALHRKLGVKVTPNSISFIENEVLNRIEILNSIAAETKRLKNKLTV